MKEKLIIKNFGPIKDVELELGRFNVLIGESGTGKSTAVKVLAACRYFSFLIDRNAISDHNFENGLNAWGLSEYYQLGSYIFFDCEHYTFEAERKIVYDEFIEEDGKELIRMPVEAFVISLKSKTKSFENLVKQYYGLQENAIKENSWNIINWQAPSIFYTNDVSAVLDNPFFVHAERSLETYFSLSKDSIVNISSAVDKQFIDAYNIAKTFSKETTLEPLSVVYKFENGQGVIRKTNQPEHDFIRLANAASGYKSAIPIILVVKNYSLFRKKKKKFIVEEPEISLFPISQMELINFFAESLNFHKEISLTTHSPYILTSLNNLMYAYQVGQEHAEEVDKIIERKYWINPDDVSAYRLMTDGTAKNILDAELKQADAGELDGISRSINKEWDKLLKIEMNGQYSEAE